MAKGSVRKKGKKWYYRFYVEDASGNLVDSGKKASDFVSKCVRVDWLIKNYNYDAYAKLYLKKRFAAKKK